VAPRAARLVAWDHSAARAAAQQLAHALAPSFVRDDGPVLRAAIARWL
jgi:hypothetical protein